MHYKRWNKIKLNEQLKLAKKAFTENPTTENAIIINTLLDVINNQPNIFTKEKKFDDQVQADIDVAQTHSDFIPYIKDFVALDDGFNTKLLPPLNELDITTRSLLAFVHDFYNSFDRDVARYFNKIFKERNNNLRITNKNQKGFNRNYMTFIPTLDYAYINISKTNTVEDYINIVHEYAHTIADQIRFRPRYGKYPFIELLPMLMQEFACDEIVRCLDDLDEEVFKSDAYTTKTILNYSKEILLQDDYLSTNNTSLERKQFISSMAQYTNNTKSKTGKILDMSLQEKMSYAVPFLVMIELYDLMYQDKEKALYTIRQIIAMDECDDYISYLESLGININEHSEKYVEDQKKKLRLTHLM